VQVEGNKRFMVGTVVGVVNLQKNTKYYDVIFCTCIRYGVVHRGW
jgi:hypothetical protein